ncbi:hypothetical protein [Streptomyces sp. CA-111067]|uniref:hypothetical protein n=1 Tax=Streptomyces sp. CA-111067 TaxID=3240046 RepID=UPI003D995ABC
MTSMPVLPRPSRRRPAARSLVCAAATVALALTASACSSSPSGPKAKESAAKMAADARWLAQYARGYFTATTDYKVTQDATQAVSCGHGKERYSFAGHQTFRIGPVHTYLNHSTVATESWLMPRGYGLDFDVEPDNDYYTRNSEVLINKKAHIHLTVTATASGDHPTTELWTTTGRTDCLRTG